MQRLNHGRTWACCLLAAGALVLVGCGKGKSGDKTKSKGKAPMGSVMGGGMTTGPARPGPRTRPAPVGQVAGVKVWGPKWPKSLKPQYKTFVKAAKKKDYKAALVALDEMKKLQPHILSIDYKLAYIKALSGDAKGALAHLQTLLYANYPKYSYKVATDKDLASLKKAPHKKQLDALVEGARVAHVAAWKKASFFVGANLRAFKYKRKIRGSQEIFGYVPETGRYVGVTYVDAANAIGYLVTPDRSAMIYVAASKFVAEEGEHRFADAEVHALSLTTGKRLKVWTHGSHPGGGYHGQVRAADAEKARTVGPEDAGVTEILLEQLKTGAYRLAFKAASVGDVADKEHTFLFTATGDAVTPVSDETARASRAVNHLRVRMCGAKAKRLTWARKIKKDGASFEIGGKAVAFACAGLVWRSPDKAKVIFQPYRYCRKHASKLDGLYVVDAAGKFTRVSPKHDTWDLKWTSNTNALVQFGGQVGYVDAAKPSFKLLGPLAAHLRAFGPRAIPKCED